MCSLAKWERERSGDCLARSLARPTSLGFWMSSRRVSIGSGGRQGGDMALAVQDKPAAGFLPLHHPSSGVHPAPRVSCRGPKFNHTVWFGFSPQPHTQPLCQGQGPLVSQILRKAFLLLFVHLTIVLCLARFCWHLSLLWLLAHHISSRSIHFSLLGASGPTC